MLKNLKIFIMLLPFMTLMTAHSLTLAADVTRTENNKEANAGTLVFHVQVGEYNLIQEAIQNQIRLNSLGIRTGVIRANEGSTIRLVVMNTERSIAFNRDTASSMIDFLKKINIDAKLISLEGQGNQNQVSSSQTESEVKIAKAPSSNKEWYQYLSGRWASGDKCLTSKNDNDGGVFQVSWGLLITAISYRQIVDGRVVIEGTFFVSAKDSSNEATYTGYIDKVDGQKANIRSESLLRYQNPDSYLIISQSLGKNVVISNGRHVKTGEEVILKRCDTPDALADRQKFQERISLVQRKQQLAMKAQQDAAVAEEGRRRAAEREEKERRERQQQQEAEERSRQMRAAEDRLSEALREKNLKLIYKRGDLSIFAVAEDSAGRRVYLQDGKSVNAAEAREELIIFNNYLKAAAEEENIRQKNLSRSWTVVAQGVGRCSVTRLIEYPRGNDGRARFGISHFCQSAYGGGGSSGQATIECSYDGQNFIRSTTVVARCQ